MYVRQLPFPFPLSNPFVYQGSEMPLGTNDEMSCTLRRYNEQNDIEGLDPKASKYRWENAYEIKGDPPEIKVRL